LDKKNQTDQAANNIVEKSGRQDIFEMVVGFPTSNRHFIIRTDKT